MVTKPKPWIPLHVHSEYSALDGIIRIPPYVRWCEKNEVPAATVTDHGVMSGHVDLDIHTSKTNIKPIFGCELYATSLTGDPFWSSQGERDRVFHLLAIALSQKGYRNLMKLVTASHRNYKRKPLTTRSMIEEYGEDIVFSTACIEGELPSIFASKDSESGKADRAKAFVDTMTSLVGRERFFVELLDIGDNSPLQKKINAQLNDFASQMGLKTILTTDSHYFIEDRMWHEYILAAQTKKTIYDDKRLSLADFDLSLRAPEQMWERWGEIYPEALRNTVEIASMVQRFQMRPDKFLLPHIDAEAPLPELARRGLGNIFEEYRFDPSVREKYRDRLEHELEIVHSMGFADYFLMVHDVVRWARQQDIIVGPGRGSAAGSLLAWTLGITSIDPIRFNLIFERFLNPARISMPDIDLDFEDERRGEVIAYLQRKYGENAVSPIINFSRPDWKQALRDSARVQGYEYGWSDKLVKSLEAIIGLAAPHLDEEETEQTVQEMIKQATQRALEKKDVEKVVRLASKMRGLLRHYGRHAAGMIIAPGDITDYVPLCSLKGDLVAQYDMSGIDYMKLVKMDILGLSTLTTIRKTVEYSQHVDPDTPNMNTLIRYLNRNGTLDDMASEIPIEDRHGIDGITRKSISDTLIMLGQGDATGIFQLASQGMRKLLVSVKPKNIDELSALIALYRPGPLNSGMTKAYGSKKREVELRREKGEHGVAVKTEPIVTFPESVRGTIEDIAGDTLGIVVYQEHVIRIAQEVAGYTAGEADLLRRAMGKKKTEVMDAEKEHFVKAAVENGIPEKDAAQVFDKLAYFSGYGFNKSHSTAYAFLAFITAWYKATRPQSFWAALLCEKSSKKQEEFALYLREATRTQKIIPPAIKMGKGFRNFDLETSILINKKKGPVRDLLKSRDNRCEVWNIIDAWAIRLGLDFLKGWSGKKIKTIEDVPFDRLRTLQDLLWYLIFDDEGRNVSPGNIGTLCLSGVLDYMLRRTISKSGRGFAPYQFRLELIKLNDGDFKRYIPGTETTLYSLLYMGIRDFTKKPPDGDFPFVVRQSNGFWGSYLDYVISHIRHKMTLKKRFWSRDMAENYVKEKLFPIIDGLLTLAEDNVRAMHVDFSSRIRGLQTLYMMEKEYFGESLSVPSHYLAQEMISYRYTFFADEITTARGYFNRLDRGEIKTPLDEAVIKRGVWILGYFQKLWTDSRSGNMKLILAGRWGSYSPALFIGVDRDTAKYIKNNKYIKKDEIIAVKASRKGWNWEIDDGPEYVVPIPVNSFAEGSDYSPIILPRTAGEPVFVRIPIKRKDPGGISTIKYLVKNNKIFYDNDFRSGNTYFIFTPKILEETSHIACQPARNVINKLFHPQVNNKIPQL